jgi:hypothetical protein
MASYGGKSSASTGNVSQSRLNRRNREIRANDQKARAYRGNQRVFERSNRSVGLLVNKGGGTLETSSYRGSISRKSVKKTNKRNAANNRRSGEYRGTTSLKSLRSRDRRIERNNKKIREYRGDIRAPKRPKGAYPGSSYRGGKANNAYQKKAKYRERMLKRLNKNKKLQQPSYQRQKYEKPTYDSRESEIWNKPGKPGTIKKK